jgi:FtsZ-binding cell division protein ZapB
VINAIIDTPAKLYDEILTYYEKRKTIKLNMKKASNPVSKALLRLELKHIKKAHKKHLEALRNNLDKFKIDTSKLSPEEKEKLKAKKEQLMKKKQEYDMKLEKLKKES